MDFNKLTIKAQEAVAAAVIGYIVYRNRERTA